MFKQLVRSRLSTKFYRCQYKSCNIVVVGNPDDACLTELRSKFDQMNVLAIGNSIDDINDSMMADVGCDSVNVVFNVSGTSKTLGPILRSMTNLQWVHSLTAGIDHITIPELTDNHAVILTNAKGVYSSTLAEYVMGACSYFWKDIPRLMSQKQSKTWQQYPMKELKGTTMGIIGYGDIGMACARLAKAYGMKVIGLRRRPELSKYDKLLDENLGMDCLHDVMARSDCIVVAAALTPETHNMISAEALAHSKHGQLFMNIGRGAIVNEPALIAAVQSGRLAGVALDVFCNEPLPLSSPIWGLPNALLSPHNADMTLDFRHKSVRFFIENCQRFVDDKELKCVVSAKKGY